MKTELSYLPRHKVQELEQIKTLIRQDTSYPAKMIILFGSYARGEWVEDVYEEDGITYEYRSDFDLLVIVPPLSSFIQSRLARQWEEQLSQNPHIDTPISIIAHDAEFINQQLMKHQYFFSDIQREGVLLFDTQQVSLMTPKTLSVANRYECAVDDFAYWFQSAKHFYNNFEFNLRKSTFSIAAFELHQCTERLYNTILLVFTHYKPKVHALDILRKLANSIDDRFLRAFPLGNAQEKRLFELLCQGYIEARYKKSYEISEAELKHLQQRVQVLEQLTQTLCQEKIQKLKKEKDKNHAHFV
jgi:predicted nucleotidyltransferase/HEPN domain-containing protein